MQLHSEERSSAGVYLVVACDWGEQFYAWCHGVSLSQHHLAALYGHVYISGEARIVAHHLPCLGAFGLVGKADFVCAVSQSVGCSGDVAHGHIGCSRLAASIAFHVESFLLEHLLDDAVLGDDSCQSTVEVVGIEVFEDGHQAERVAAIGSDRESHAAIERQLHIAFALCGRPYARHHLLVAVVATASAAFA